MTDRVVGDDGIGTTELVGPTETVDFADVLLVDDDEALLRLTATYLERESDVIRPTTASGGAAALELLDSRSFDGIVSDYDMPEMDGLELLAAVRERDGSLPFVLFTGKGSEEIASQAISAGVSDYLQKGGPDQYTLLANRVETLVEKRRTELALDRRMRAIESAREGIALLDEDGCYLYLNEAYAGMHGYSADDLVGQSWEVLSTDRDVAAFSDEIIPQIRDGGTWQGRTVGVRADGSEFTKDLSLTYMDDGCHICVSRDLSASDAPGTDQSTIDTVVGAHRAGALVVDGDRIVHASDGVLALVQQHRNGLSDEPVDVLGESVATLVARVLDTDQSATTTASLPGHGGTEVECDCRAAPLTENRVAVLVFPK
ncbi:response regulator [Haloarchaeobius sp. DFWS5]|uniref:PAS domain-containing protein n=1 Tax=Haloarchaeobius sp. DFWS5 TaxID=3446114 RepID=UPI003EB8FDFE